MSGALCTLAACSACTLLTNFDIEQCALDSDCKGSSEAPARICEERRCVAGCRDNAHCKDALNTGATALCPRRGAECVELESGACFRALGPEPPAFADKTGDDLALLGLFAPKLASGQRSAPELNYLLAIDELNEDGGLPGPRGPRPLVGVVCENQPAAVTAGVEHLVQRLGVRAVLASLEREPLRNVVEGRDDDVFFLSPFGDPGRSVARSERLWYLFAGQDAVVAAYTPLFRRLTAKAARERQRPAEELVLAILYSSAPDADADRSLQLAVEEELDLDGERGLALTQSGMLRRFALGDEGELRAVASSMAEYAPDIVFVFASGTFSATNGEERSAVVRELEAEWPSERARPLYVFGPNNSEDDTLTALGSAAEFRARLVGLNVHREQDSDLAVALASRYAERFSAASSRYAAVANLYDGAYLLAYALAAAGLRTDADVLAGFRAVTDLANGQRVDVGSGGIGDAFSLLRAGEPIAVHGVTGAPDFDVTTHARSSGASPYCLLENSDGDSPPASWSVDHWVYSDALRDFAWRDAPATPEFCVPGLFE
jgi:hypothetical protein